MTNNTNKKPDPLDPEQIVGGDASPANDEEDERTPNSAVFRFGAARKPTGKALTPSPMEESFSNESVPEHIDNVRRQLGVISRFIQGRAVEKIQREHVIKLTAALFDFQYQDMRHVLLLSMDAQKGRRFVQYLEATDEIRTRLQEQSAQAQLSIVETMFDQRLLAFRAQRARDQKSAAAYQRGEMNKEQHERALWDSQELTDQHEARLNQTVEEMLTRHSELLYETLALFKTDLIKSGKLN
jgi:hypothetical protein